MSFVHFTYHRKDDNMLVTCIHSLRNVCPDSTKVHIILTTDGIPKEVADLLHSKYVVYIDWVKKEQMVKRRAACKVERLGNLVGGLSMGDVVLASDVDVVFLKNPFTAMYKLGFDLGFTTRGYKHLFPINGGIFYVLISSATQAWMKWHVDEVHKPTWKPYVDHRRRCNHAHFGLDWSVGQDFLVACWYEKEQLRKEYGLIIKDVGPEYNYCPPTDTMGDQAFVMAWEALEKQSVTTLHLKSELKKMLYDPRFPDAQILYPRGTWAWA